MTPEYTTPGKVEDPFDFAQGRPFEMTVFLL
jgi:hypothetical protein